MHFGKRKGLNFTLFIRLLIMFEILEFIEEPPNALWKKKRAQFHTFYYSSRIKDWLDLILLIGRRATNPTISHWLIALLGHCHSVFKDSA